MKKKKKIKRKVGVPSGTFTYVGENEKSLTTLELVEYDKESCVFRQIDNLIHLNKEFTNDITPKLRWLRVNGLADANYIAEIGKFFKIHPLTIEDILNTYQRPKAEEYEKYLFSVVKKITLKKTDCIETEQIGIILMQDLIITFYDGKDKVYKEIDDKILSNKGNVRDSSDYLFYVILDNIVDHYFVVMDNISDTVEELYEGLIENTVKDGLNEIKNLQKDMHKIRQAFYPFREVLGRLQKQEFALINKDLAIYFRDINDHFHQIIEIFETNKESLYSMLNVHLSGTSNQLNEVMKVLTIISTIFIPLTFIAGVYGMNFKHMPELEWKYAYFVIWGLMIAIGISLGYWFKKNKWL